MKLKIFFWFLAYTTKYIHNSWFCQIFAYQMFHESLNGKWIKFCGIFYYAQKFAFFLFLYTIIIYLIIYIDKNAYYQEIS